MPSTNLENGPLWYAISTRSRQERLAAKFLENVGITAFLPAATEVRRWSDRNQAILAPLFPGYLFVQMPAINDMRVQVLKTPGVVNFVGNRGIPLSIPEKEINDVRLLLSERITCLPYPFLRIGQRVRVIGGALDQIEGTLVGQGPDSKLVLSIELIQRSLAINLYDFHVEPISNGGRYAA